MHRAFLLPTIFASLARDERNFSQAELDSEINACFPLNKHSNPLFLLLNNSVHVILFNFKISKENYQKENRYR